MKTYKVSSDFRDALGKIIQAIYRRKPQNKTILAIEREIAERLDINIEKVKDWRRGRGKMPEFFQLRDLAEVLKKIGATREEIVDLVTGTNYQPRDIQYIIDNIFPSLYPERVARSYDSSLGKFSAKPTAADSSLALPSSLPYVLLPPVRRPFCSTEEGRERDIRSILLMINNREVCDVTGPPGFGKTSVVTEVVWRLFPEGTRSPDFPNGVIYHDFRKDPSVDSALRKIVQAFAPNAFDGENPLAHEAAAQLLLANCKALLVLDSVESAENYSRILDVRGQCRIVVISRRKQDATILDPYVIDRLSSDEAISILRVSGRNLVGDDEVATQLCQIVDYMPLAIELIGIQLSAFKKSGSKMLEELRESRLDALDFGQNPEQSIRALFNHLVAQFDEDSRMVLPVIGLLAQAPFPREVISQAWSQPLGKNELRKIGRALDRLVSYHWLDQKEDNMYEVHHALMHDYAQEQGAAPEIAARLVEYYLSKTDEHAALTREDLVWWDRARPHLLKLLSDCKQRQEWEETKRLVSAIDPYLYLQGYWLDRLLPLQAGLAAARALEDRPGEVDWLIRLGNNFLDQGHYQDALEHYQQALILSRTCGDHKSEGVILVNLGNIFSEKGEREQALVYHLQALDIAKEVDDRRILGTVLVNLSGFYESKEDWERAIHYLQQALAIAEELQDRLLQGFCLGNLGVIYGDKGDWQPAVHYIREALAISEELKNRFIKSGWLGRLGDVQLKSGDYEAAVESLEEALTIAQQIGDRQGEGIYLGSLGLVYKNQRQYNVALAYIQEALEVAREIGNTRNLGQWLHSLGQVYAGLEQYEKATDYYQQALPAVRNLDDRPLLGILLRELGQTLLILGKSQAGAHYLEEALNIVRERLNRHAEGLILIDLGNAYANSGQYQQAILYYQQAQIITQEVNDRQSEGAALGNLGGVYAHLGDWDRAIHDLQGALDIAQEVGDRLNQGGYLVQLGTIYRDLGQEDDAINSLNKALTIAQEFGSLRLECAVRGNLGSVYTKLRSWEQATCNLKKSLTIAHELGIRPLEGSAHGFLGSAYADQGDWEQATYYLQQALAIAKEVGDRSNQAAWTGNLGIIYYNQGEYEQAVACFKQALAIDQEIGDYYNQEQILKTLGDVYYQLGRQQEALDAYEETLRFGPDDIQIHKNLATIYQDLRLFDKATEFYHYLARTSPENAANAYANLGIIARYQNEEKEAQAYFETALGLIRERALSVPLHLLAEALEDKALVLLGMGEKEEALYILEEALDQWPPNAPVALTRYELLGSAPNPPAQLDSVYQSLKRFNMLQKS